MRRFFECQFLQIKVVLALPLVSGLDETVCQMLLSDSTHGSGVREEGTMFNFFLEWKTQSAFWNSSILCVSLTNQEDTLNNSTVTRAHFPPCFLALISYLWPTQPQKLTQHARVRKHTGSVKVLIQIRECALDTASKDVFERNYCVDKHLFSNNLIPSSDPVPILEPVFTSQQPHIWMCLENWFQ